MPTMWCFGNVGDVRLAEERQDVMLAHREEVEVLEHDHLRVVLDEERAVDDRLGIFVYPLVRYCRARATRSGVFTSPSRSGSSPRRCRISVTAFSIDTSDIGSDLNQKRCGCNGRAVRWFGGERGG